MLSDRQIQEAINRMTPEQRKELEEAIRSGKPVDIKVGDKDSDLSGLAVDEGKKELLKYGRDQVKSEIKDQLGLGAGAGVAQAATGGGAASQLGGMAIPGVGEALGGAELLAPSGWELSGIGSAGNYIAPIAGGVGLYDLYANRPENIGHGSGYLQGAASGAALGSYFGPVGAAVGGGLGLLANAFGIGGKSRTKVEEDRRKALADEGITVPNYDVKEWEQNEAFRDSRKEADLKGGDIENAASFYGITGYKDADQAKKEAIAQKAIEMGLIREHHGTIDLSMTPEYEAYLKGELGGGQSTGGVDVRQAQAEAKKNRKRQALSSLMPEIMSTPTTGPRYDLNPGNLISNPYL